MTYGIIYRAYNKISKKSYVGQSVNSLSDRIKGHYKSAKINNHKFANALNCYSPDTWVWEILIEVEEEKLNEYEMFFIEDLDTFRNGYNSTNGTVYSFSGSPTNRQGNIYELYHSEKGFIKGRRYELIQIEPSLKNVCALVSGEKKSIKGWILACNKDKIVRSGETVKNGGIHEFYHSEKGSFVGRASEFYREHLLDSDIPLSRVHNLIRGKSQKCDDWVLVKRGSCPYQSSEVQEPFELEHPEHGVVKLTLDNFIQEYGLTRYGIGELKRETRKKHRKWSLPNAHT